MSTDSQNEFNNQVREAWDANAAIWDEWMGDDGNDFHLTIVRPATETLLAVKPGDRILEIGCGNGLFTRRLANMGAKVIAIDISEQMIAHARSRTRQDENLIDYRLIDATDEKALLELGKCSFDAAASAMTLMDMAEIDPLMNALTKLLKPGGCFVFSVLHPCFNNPHVTMGAEETDREGELVTEYSVKISKYLQPSVTRGLALRDQTKPHLYFHRPLHVLFGAAFRVGFVLDGLEEPTFPRDRAHNKYSLTWGSNFSQIPPAIVVRLRLLAS